MPAAYSEIVYISAVATAKYVVASKSVEFIIFECSGNYIITTCAAHQEVRDIPLGPDCAICEFEELDIGEAEPAGKGKLINDRHRIRRSANAEC